MSAVRAPRTVAQATALLERHAALQGLLEAVEGRRGALIARANARADAAATPLLAELQAIAARLEPWWQDAGRTIAGKRKSIELGGCTIGTRASRPKLAHGFEDDDKAVEALRATRYGRQTVRLRYSVDRVGTVKLLQLGGKAAETLQELGFRVDQGEEFFVQRVEQAGTRKA
ncbi:MAG: host-nuclease inhibitor Gam family protein [Pseudomonadota bacterium]|nr:host-nuclease inhibitor Gam family protein [Pseudomonadota bacterium]